MEAARVLDLETYGIDGETRITFPMSRARIREGDQGAVDLAVARARSTIDRAGTLISQSDSEVTVLGASGFVGARLPRR